MKKPLANTAASIRQRLLHVARERKEDFGLVLTKYGLERVLYRISKSKYRESFVLKGALLFELWTQKRYRPTRDADFLVRGENNLERFGDIFRLICEMRVEDDGLRFDADTVTAERITEDADYEGVRVKFVGYLEQARIPIQNRSGLWRCDYAGNSGNRDSIFAGFAASAAPDVSAGECSGREV